MVHIWHKQIPDYRERMIQIAIHALWAITGNDKEMENWTLS